MPSAASALPPWGMPAGACCAEPDGIPPIAATWPVGPAAGIAPMPWCCIIGAGVEVTGALAWFASTNRSHRLPQRTASPCLNMWLWTRCSWK